MDRLDTPRIIRSRPSFNHILLVVAVALVTGLLTQCRLVDDSITGVNLSTSDAVHNGRSRCVRRCNEAYKVLRRAENRRHKDAKRACNRDHACRMAEKQLHYAIVADLKEQRRLCRRSCYNEGAGSGGR